MMASIQQQAAYIKQYTRPIVADGLSVELLLPPSSIRVAWGVLNGCANRIVITTAPDPTTSLGIAINPQVLEWYHWEKYLTFVQQGWWVQPVDFGLSVIVYEILIP